LAKQDVRRGKRHKINIHRRTDEEPEEVAALKRSNSGNWKLGRKASAPSVAVSWLPCQAVKTQREVPCK